MGMKSYLAAAVQMTSQPNLEANLAQAEELIELAVRRGAELVGLPENFSFLGDDREKVAQAATIAERTEAFLKRMAQRFQITLVGVATQYQQLQAKSITQQSSLVLAEKN